jgi:hypothetical protein
MAVPVPMDFSKAVVVVAVTHPLVTSPACPALSRSVSAPEALARLAVKAVGAILALDHGLTVRVSRPVPSVQMAVRVARRPVALVPVDPLPALLAQSNMLAVLVLLVVAAMRAALAVVLVAQAVQALLAL